MLSSIKYLLHDKLKKIVLDLHFQIFSLHSIGYLVSTVPLSETLDINYK